MAIAAVTACKPATSEPHGSLLEWMGDDPAFVDVRPDDPCLRLHIESVSSDGKGLCLFSSKSGMRDRRLFDVEKRRFAVIADGFELVQPVKWYGDRLLVREAVGDEKPRKVPYFEVGLKGGAARLLFRELSSPFKPLPSSGLTLDDLLPWGIDLNNIRCASSRNRIMYAFTRRPKKKDADPRARQLPREQDLVVYDRRSGESHVLPDPNNGESMTWAWGWTPEESAIVYTCGIVIPDGPQPLSEIRSRPIKDICFFHPDSQRPPHKVPVYERFQKLRKTGALDRDEDVIYSMTLMALPKDGRKARFLVTFYSEEAKKDPKRDRSSVWDMDLEAGNLTRVMALTMGPAYDSIVQSPSGASFVAPALGNREYKVHGSSPPSLALYREGEEPRVLPFQIMPSGGGIGPGNRHFPTLFWEIRFLDEDTLVYTGVPYDLWRFDLRTWKSELLWNPKAAAPRMNNPKRTTDN